MSSYRDHHEVRSQNEGAFVEAKYEGPTNARSCKHKEDIFVAQSTQGGEKLRAEG